MRLIRIIRTIIFRERIYTQRQVSVKESIWGYDEKTIGYFLN
jgi:hypothetical protein